MRYWIKWAVAIVVLLGIVVAVLEFLQIGTAKYAALRNRSINHCKEIGMAFLAYEAEHGRFPATANYSKSGRPLLSWRVHLLKYLGEEELYQKFKLDQPWDSEHNKKLIPHMPSIYRSPLSDGERGKANYAVPVGDGLMFDGQLGKRKRDIRDGVSKTIMLLEIDDQTASIWTKPEDWQFNPKQPYAGLMMHYGANSGDFFIVGFCDGHVISTLKNEPFKECLTIAGGETFGRH